MQVLGNVSMLNSPSAQQSQEVQFDLGVLVPRVCHRSQEDPEDK